jgi:intracellular multiplication protein IcmL
MQSREQQQDPAQQSSEETGVAAPQASGFGMSAAMAADQAAPSATAEGGTPPADTAPADPSDAAPAAAQDAGTAAPDAAEVPPAAEGQPAAEGAAAPAPVDDKEMEKQMGGGAAAAPLKLPEKTAKAVAQIEEVKARGEKRMGDAAKAPLNRQKLQTEFYRDRFHRLVQMALFNAVIIAALIITIIFYMFQTRPDDRFFATTIDGRILQLTALDHTNLSDSALFAWLVEASMDTMSFGFHDFQRRLQSSTQYFTRDGWESFASMLQEMRLIETLEQGQMVVSMVPRSAPVVIQRGVVEGRYRWVIDMDFNVTLQGRGQGNARPLRLRLTVDRVPALENVKGVAIARWAPRPGSATH